MHPVLSRKRRTAIFCVALTTPILTGDIHANQFLMSSELGKQNVRFYLRFGYGFVTVKRCVLTVVKTLTRVLISDKAIILNIMLIAS